MAAELNIRDQDGILHLQSCMLHKDERLGLCSGTLRKNGVCANRATDSPVPGMMPTCRIHREQLKASSSCRAKLTCGYNCGRLFEGQPHDFQLCDSHREYPMRCYFLEIPSELRIRVYRFLIPDRPIPARYLNSTCLTADGGQVYVAIMRVNRHIHDEVASLLYSTRSFTVEISENYMGMCNSAKKLLQPRINGGGNHALQDYQMQLMLLEQQNKKRLIMARQAQDATSGESSRAPATTRRVFPDVFSIPNTCRATGPIWYPPISGRYFNMIRHLLVEFVFPFQRPSQNASPRNGTPNMHDTNEKTLESRLYDYCDSIHRLIGRIQLMPQPTAHIEINIKFFTNYRRQEDSFMAAPCILRPFQRLRGISEPRLLSITMCDSQFDEVELLTQEWHPCDEKKSFFQYLEYWQKNILSSDAPVENSKIFDAYWQLEDLLLRIKSQSNYNYERFRQFDLLLRTARLARESDDLMIFKKVWSDVLNIWLDYVNFEKDFQSSVGHSVNIIYDMIGGASNNVDDEGTMRT